MPPPTNQRVSYWKLMEINEQCLDWVAYMPETTVQEYPILSQNVPLGIGTYYMPEHDVLYTRIGLQCHRSQRNRPRGLWHTRQEVRGVGVPVHPTETPDGLLIESQVIVVQHCMATINTKAISVPISFLHPGVSWVLYYRLSGDNIHNVFTIIQYPWLINYRDQQEYSIKSLLVQGFRNTWV